MKTGIIIQARLGSERLPRKSLLPIPEDSGVSMVRRVIERCQKSKMADLVILDVPRTDAELAKEYDLVYPGSVDRDVLDDFYNIARFWELDCIVRITGDCPCICPEIIDDAVVKFITMRDCLVYNRNDNVNADKGIDGLDVEVFHRGVLGEAYRNATGKDREHVTSWIYKNMPTRCIGTLPDIPLVKLSVDTEEDYKRVCNLYKDLGENFTAQDVVRYFAR